MCESVVTAVACACTCAARHPAAGTRGRTRHVRLHHLVVQLVRVALQRERDFPLAPLAFLTFAHGLHEPLAFQRLLARAPHHGQPRGSRGSVLRRHRCNGLAADGLRLPGALLFLGGAGSGASSRAPAPLPLALVAAGAHLERRVQCSPPPALGLLALHHHPPALVRHAAPVGDSDLRVARGGEGRAATVTHEHQAPRHGEHARSRSSPRHTHTAVPCALALAVPCTQDPCSHFPSAPGAHAAPGTCPWVRAREDPRAREFVGVWDKSCRL